MTNRPLHRSAVRPRRIWVERLEERLPLAGDFGFAHALGSTGADLARAMTLDAEGNAYIAGEFRGVVDFDPGLGVATLTASGSGAPDAFVAKYSPTGQLVWAQQFGSTGLDWATDLALDPAGNVWVTGYYSGTVDFDNDVGFASQTAVGAAGGFLVKLAADGKFMWAGSIDSLSGEHLTALAIDQSGNVFVTGQYNGVGDFDPGPETYTLTSQSTFDAFLTKLDNDGGLLWAKSWGGSTTSFNGDTAVDVAVDLDGNAYVTGEFLGTADLDPSPTTQTVNATGTHDMYVSKFSADGDLAWARVIAGSTVPRAIAVDGDANVYTTGNLQSATDFDPGAGNVSLSAANGGSDVFVSKLDANGSFVWARQLGGTIGNDGYAIAIDGNNDVYITGQMGGSNADYNPGPGVFTLSSAGSSDIFVSRLTPAGLFVSAARLGGTLLERGRAIAVHPLTKDIYLAGQFNGTVDFDPDVTLMSRRSAGGDDIFLVKLTQTTISGRVWIDSNFNGIRDDGEIGPSNQTVEFWTTLNDVIGDADDSLIGAFQADVNGRYMHTFWTSFGGTYFIRVTLPPRHTLSPANMGDDESLDSDISRETELAEILTRDETGATLAIDAGIFDVVDNPWHNSADPPNVDGLAGIVPLDALLIINALNSSGVKRLAYPLPEGTTPEAFYDVNDDLLLTPLDAALVITYLNSLGAGEEELLFEPQASTAAVATEDSDLQLLSLYRYWLEAENAGRKQSTKAGTDE